MSESDVVTKFEKCSHSDMSVCFLAWPSRDALDAPVLIPRRFEYKKIIEINERKYFVSSKRRQDESGEITEVVSYSYERQNARIASYRGEHIESISWGRGLDPPVLMQEQYWPEEITNKFIHVDRCNIDVFESQ